MDRTKTITIDTEKELYNILPEMIEPKRKGKSGVKTRKDSKKSPDTQPRMEVPEKPEPKGYRLGGKVRLAKKGKGKAYGKNS